MVRQATGLTGPNTKNLTVPRYLYYALKKANLSAKTITTSIPGLNRDDLYNTTIALPPLPEQKRIAAILDKADAIRRKRQQAIQLADDFLRAVFLDMFGDPVTNPKGWECVSLEDVCSHIIDCPHSTPEWTESGVIGLRTSNLTKGGWSWEDKRFVSEATYLERTKRATLEPGDIVLSREGTVGIAAIVPEGERMCMGQRLVQLRCNLERILPEYLLFFMLYELEPERIARVMAGSTSKHLNVKDLRALQVMLPPQAMQSGFSKIMRQAREGEESVKKSLARLDVLFASISQAAFSGRL